MKKRASILNWGLVVGKKYERPFAKTGTDEGPGIFFLQLVIFQCCNIWGNLI